MKRTWLSTVNSQTVVLVILTITLAFASGASFLLVPAVYAPVLVLAGLAAVVGAYACIRKPVLALYFSLFVIFLPTSLIPADISSLLNRTATILALGVWLLDTFLRRRKFRLSISAWLMLGFIAWAAVTWLWAGNQDEGLTTIQMYVFRFALFLLVMANSIRSKNDLNGLMYTIALSGGLLVAVSLVTIALQGFTPGGRLKVLNVNENSLGINLLFATPAVLWWAFYASERPHPARKWIAAAYLAISIALIGLSGSRGSAISLGITLLVFLLFNPTRGWGLSGLVVVGLAAVVAPVIFATTIERFLVAPGDTVLGGREYIWPAAMNMINQHFFTGVGIGNSPYEIIPYLRELGPYWIVPTGEPLHQPLLVIWSETGLFGLLLYVGVMASAVFLFVREFFRRRRWNQPDLMPYFALLASIFLGYMASWIKGGGMETDFSYFLMLALLIIPSELKIRQPAGGSPK